MSSPVSKILGGFDSLAPEPAGPNGRPLGLVRDATRKEDWTEIQNAGRKLFEAKNGGIFQPTAEAALE